MPKTAEYIFYQGDKFQVEFYFNELGELPAKEYLEQIARKGSFLEVTLKLAALVKCIAESGRIYDKTKFRIVYHKEKIYEFKPSGYRFFNFFYKDRKIVITNGYKKQSQKVDRKELQKAINIKRDYFRRIEGGTYYGKEKS